MKVHPLLYYLKSDAHFMPLFSKKLYMFRLLRRIRGRVKLNKYPLKKGKTLLLNLQIWKLMMRYKG